MVLLMVAVLNRTLFKPITKILADREKRTGGTLSEAAEMRRRAEIEKAHYEQALREARSSKYKLLEDQRNESLRDRQEKLESVKREIETGIDKQKAVIESQSKAARAVLSETANTLAADIRDQILRPAGSRRMN